MSVATDANTKPKNYKVLCISMYNGDVKELDEMVKSLKDRGVQHASRSSLIRHALNNVDLTKIDRTLR